MRLVTRLMCAATLSLAVAAPASQAAAQETIAQFFQATPGKNVSWVNQGTGGHLYTGTGASAAGVATFFNFLTPELVGIGPVTATFLLDATAAAGNPAQLDGNGGISQDKIAGSFSFTYTGMTPLAGCLGGSCKNLLSGTFNQGLLSGDAGGSTGDVGSSTSLAGHLVNFTSDYIDFTLVTWKDFDFGLEAISPALTASPGQALDSFQAASSGSFGAAVPEPATWAMMILGFGGIGSLLRSRRRGMVLSA
ncbi:MAG TPA: PEPxxWA-CTERM sorting domain-containing protein [Phenylobacterium sp.]